MFIYIASILQDYICGLGLFKYISFRAIAALLTSAFIVFMFGKKFIKFIKSWQVDGQPIREDGPVGHFKKSGTPTMGGLMMLAGILISSILWCNLSDVYVWLLIFTAITYGMIGFYDDYLKVKKQTASGFSAKMRLSLELLIGLIVSYVIWKHNSSGIAIPFIKSYIVNLGLFFLPFAALVILGTGNAVNLTDGLDGLAIVPIMVASLAFALIAYLCGNFVFANYLQIAYVPGTGEIAVVLASVIGAGLGFLWFNAPPAAMFMGDTGSLALGGLLGAASVATKQELILAIIGGVFVMEALSVIIQVVSYKMRKKRVFLMAPIHHHFEKKGWSESQVVIRFWIISIFLALLGLLTLKIR